MSMSLVSISRKERLKERACMLKAVRQFFDVRGVIEVDTPLMQKTAPIDVHIDCIPVYCCGEKGFLHSSPEIAMKRLLCEGVGDCYQLGHVFRDFEKGKRHAPEFTMLEWYRLGFTLDQLMDECREIVSLFIPNLNQKVEKIPYHALFEQFLGRYPESEEERSYALAFEIEPQLGSGKLTFITDYPPEQAAMACLVEKEGTYFAERFELFYEGIELANGYHELGDAKLQRSRFEKSNKERKAHGKLSYPIDEEFLRDLSKGLPDCSGVAMGFDRLMMLRHQVNSIEEIVPFVWDSEKIEAALV